MSILKEKKFLSNLSFIIYKFLDNFRLNFEKSIDFCKKKKAKSSSKLSLQLILILLRMYKYSWKVSLFSLCKDFPTSKIFEQFSDQKLPYCVNFAFIVNLNPNQRNWTAPETGTATKKKIRTRNNSNKTTTGKNEKNRRGNQEW